MPWSWSCGSWMCNYLCNQCLSPLTLWVRKRLRRGVLDTTLCDKVCRWFSPGTPVFSTNKTNRHDMTEISGIKHHKPNRYTCTYTIYIHKKDNFISQNNRRLSYSICYTYCNLNSSHYLIKWGMRRWLIC